MAHDYDYERNRYGRDYYGRYENEPYYRGYGGSSMEPYYRSPGYGTYYNEPYRSRFYDDYTSEPYQSRYHGSYYHEPYGSYDYGRYEYGSRYDEPYYRSRYGRGGERGFFERAGDEVRSWFGDEEAEQRRRADARRSGHTRGVALAVTGVPMSVSGRTSTTA